MRNKRKQEGTYLNPESDYEDFEKELSDNLDVKPWGWALYHKIFVERWSFKTGAFTLAIISGCYLIFNNKAWGVTSALHILLFGF